MKSGVNPVSLAFMVNPTSLDKVLQDLGFHPLHVRNIHHLAIYTVLSDSQKKKKALPNDYNPFSEVKQLYKEAEEFLSLPTECSPATYTYDNKETKEIREWIFTNRGLSKENFFRVVKQNKPALNMRHSLIMDDFHKLSSVYSSILTDPEMDSFNYSFYQFINRFCNGISQKKFKEHMHSTIDKDTYSLASILFYAATGLIFTPEMRIFNAEWKEQITKAYSSGISQPPSPESFASALIRFFEKGLSSNQAKRFCSAKELLNAIFGRTV